MLCNQCFIFSPSLIFKGGLFEPLQPPLLRAWSRATYCGFMADIPREMLLFINETAKDKKKLHVSEILEGFSICPDYANNTVGSYSAALCMSLEGRGGNECWE